MPLFRHPATGKVPSRRALYRDAACAYYPAQLPYSFMLSPSTKRIVIKIGTGVLTRNSGGEVHHAMIARLSQAITDLKKAGHEVVLVSSGAVGAGLSALGLDARPTAIEALQACAAAGQARLMHLYEAQFAHQGMVVGQLLVSAEDFEIDRRKANVLATIRQLLTYPQVIPVINENDSVSVAELKVGDNDTLSSIVARAIEADLLIILTSVPGLRGPDAMNDDDIITHVQNIDDVMSFARDEKGALSTGGMASKLEAVRLAVESGIETIIANGTTPEQLPDLVNGNGIGTRFSPLSPH